MCYTIYIKKLFSENSAFRTVRQSLLMTHNAQLHSCALCIIRVRHFVCYSLNSLRLFSFIIENLNAF